jgi:predicted RNA-binding protein YlxR (DUF448 family)
VTAAMAHKAPERRCIQTLKSLPRDGLIRFSVSPDGEVVPDLEEKLPGRGLWLTASADIVRRACAENSFSKAARRNVSVPDDLPARMIALFDRRCLDLIGLARRSGIALAGFEKVRAALASGRAALLIEASDGADDGREKLSRIAAGTDTFSLWTADQLGAPFGRDRAVHVAILASGLADRLRRDAMRRAGLENEDTGNGVALELQES